ncbi:MAG: hypothetical protein R3E12_18990 [Candidatus Eisenbacteria bacterium]
MAYDNAGNQFDWRGARDAYYRSLTRPTQTERLNELANTFFALGHVIHLVEDLGQPQHIRNDAHITYFPGAPYEDYCHTNYGTAAAVGGLATAPLPSFTVMASPFSGIPDEFAAFWDTGQYTGQTAFAGFAATPGLAEFSNAYFLTDDTMFGTVRTVALRRPGTTPLVLRLTEALDNNSTAAKHRFAHPSIRNTNLASFYPTETRITLQREGEDETNPLHYVDLVMPGHTTTNLFMINNSGEIGFDATTYESYAQALIPQAVAYAAQLMNMFFSPIGLSDPTTGWDATEKKNTVEIRNDSDRDFADGTWHLFYDDANGNRTEVTDFDTSAYSGLAPGASFTAKWSELLCEGGWTYTLVFQGKIGNELNAVAGKTFAPAQEVWRGTYYVPSGDPSAST